MEKYQGVKFRHIRKNNTFSYDHRLARLNHWAYLFSQLGLAPVHADGAYGNHSYRSDGTSFVITRSAMLPREILHPDDYCQIVGFDEKSITFYTNGIPTPSSESFLHNALYQSLPHINAILHGHCSLLNIYATALNIPVTKQFYDYGTPELAESAISLVDSSSRFFILKDHGFVALGEDIDTAGSLTLSYYAELIDLLRVHRNGKHAG